LKELLATGWKPVRETGMGGGSVVVAFSLVLLEKDVEEPPVVEAVQPQK